MDRTPTDSLHGELLYEVGRNEPVAFVPYLASGALAGAAPEPMGDDLKRSLVAECKAAYVSGNAELADLEHDVALILRGRAPERCLTPGRDD